MSFRIDESRVRIEFDTAAKTGIALDVISGDAARFARGARLRVECGLFYKDALADASLLTSARLRIFAAGDPDAALAMDKTIGVTAMNLGLTQDQWDSGESAKSHLIFEFSAAETSESAFGGVLDDTSDHWLLLTQGVQNDFLWAGKISSFDAGFNAAGGTPPVVGSGASLDQIAALLQTTLQGYLKIVNGPGINVTFQSPTTGKLVTLGANDDGTELIATQTDT
jgi:hypothetical protein